MSYQIKIKGGMNMKIVFKNINIIFILLIMLCSCVGGRMFISANSVKYPVSVSEGVYDKNYNLLDNSDYTIIDHFEFKLSSVYIFWTLIPLTKNRKDISALLDNVIEDKGGDAIVNLSIQTGPIISGEGFLNLFAQIIPIIPSVVVAKVEGDVIKLNK